VNDALFRNIALRATHSKNVKHAAFVTSTRYNTFSWSSAFYGTRWSDVDCLEDQMEKTARIRELNDAFRRTFVGGRVMLTASVDALPDADKAAVLAKVRTFDAFNGDNDPHGEHDFVSFEHEGERYFAKVDYYARDMRHGSNDPSDPKHTTRVMTIMRADEY
jgi:hypothetical protein